MGSSIGGRRTRKILRWPAAPGAAGAGGGKKFAFIFAKRVRHRGYRGDPYLLRAAATVADRFPSIVDDVSGV